MRIHRLSIEGIGPYATRQELDFDDLTRQGLFLLTGPTGAGKTTVLDAVVFALYGTVPGARGADGKREKGARERIVSDLRDLETKPLVELEFTAGGRRFIVQRSPDHDRPKARGTGTTLAKATATLEERVRGEWVPRSTDFREISIELESVLGMSAAQFTQVVLLPQGEFAGFLRSSVADRRRVLERLFQVDRYESAEQWFRARAELAKETLATAQADLERVIERLSGALGDAAGPDEVRRGLQGPEEISAWVSARRQEVDERVLAAERAAQDGKERFAEADRAHRRIVEIADLTRALRGREEALHTHAVRVPKARLWMASVEGEAIAADDDAWLRVAREARAYAHALDARLRDERRLPDLVREAQAADASAETAANHADQADAAAGAAATATEPLHAVADAGARAEATADGLRREHRQLAARAEAATRRDALAGQVAEAARRLASAASVAAAAGDTLAALPSEESLDDAATALVTERRSLDEMRSGLASEVAQVIREADEIAEARERHRILSERRDALSAEYALRREEHLAARTAYLQAREARLDAMAAELAAGLGDGEACPVCGSTEHPHPAGGDGTGDLRAAEAGAEQEVRRAETALATAQQALAACTGQLEGIDPDALAARAADVERRGEGGRAALAQLAQEDAALAARQEAAAAAIRERRAVAQDVATKGSAVTSLERDAGALREALATATAQAGDGPSPASELERLAAQLAAIDGQARAGAEARDRIRTLEREREAARTRSAEQRAAVAEQRQLARGLRDEASRIEADLRSVRGDHPTVEAAARAAAEHAHRLEAAAELLANHQRAQAERDAAAAALATRAADDVTLPGEPSDIEERAEYRLKRKTEAGDQATTAAGEHRVAREQQAAVEAAETTLAGAIRALGPAAEAAERLIRLDQTIRGGGDNLRKISLATYVLAARLEEVAAAATGHLLRMSDGRFELLHHDDRHGNGPAGLGLRVRDGWTGEERDTATLSGGEAFYASLSLALGLAEVVTNEAGGRPLDTLLVDEGFGSLDPDTLEDVLGVLDELRAAGRSIGLVSHVQALSDRISAQLRVTPGRTGSTATVVTATPSATA